MRCFLHILTKNVWYHIDKQENNEYLEEWKIEQ